VGDVTLEWAGVEAAAAGDWLGAFCAAPQLARKAFFDFVYVNVSSSWPRGAGSARLRLPNVRCDVVFAYVRAGTGGGDGGGVAARSGVVRFNAAPGARTTPYAARFAVAGEGALWLSWQSDVLMPAPFALVATRPGGPYTRVNGSATSYSATDMCGHAAVEAPTRFFTPGGLHHVRLSGLAPASRVHVVFGQEEGALHTELTVSTPPAAGAAEVTFVAVADVGAGGFRNCPGGEDTLAAIRRRVLAPDGGAPTADFITLAGDLSYGMGSTYIHDAFARLIEPLATRVPLLIVSGGAEPPPAAAN